MKRNYVSRWCRRAIAVVVLAGVAGLAGWVISASSVAQTPPKARTTIVIDRAPAWVLSEDPYDVFAGAVAVDPVREEIVLQSPQKLLVYDRRANTPPAARFTEPKRIIAGPKTNLDDNCGLYIDPKNGDIYSIPNDIRDAMGVFPHEAKGDVAPQRQLRVPHTVYGMAVDEESQEIFFAVGHPPAVTVFRKMAKDTDPAIRILEGDRTQLAYPHGIAVDTKNQWMYVSNHGSTALAKDGVGWGRWPVFLPWQTDPVWDIPGVRGRSYKYVDRGSVIPGTGRFLPPSITVYPLKASGDTPPARVIQGPKTRLNWPMHLHVDTEHGELYVANNTGHSILVFRITDNGDAAPVRVLEGPATVFRRTAEGDTPPLRVIRTAPQGTVAPALGQVTSIAYDSKRGEILAPN